MEKSYLVFIDDQHDYTIKSKKEKKYTIHTLYRSSGEQWEENTRGEKCVSIKEGDLEMGIFGVEGTQQYHTIFEFKLLLDFITKDYKDGKVEIIEKNIIHANK